jgi:hypothetical protein
MYDAVSGGGHAWNVVLLDGIPNLCDAMHAPGTLYKVDSQKARHYKRLALGESGEGGVGGQSVVVPGGLVQEPGKIRSVELSYLLDLTSSRTSCQRHRRTA